MNSLAGDRRSSGFGAVTYSMYPVGLERLDQCFHFGQSIKLRQLGGSGRQHRAGREAPLPYPALGPFRLCRRLATIPHPCVCADDAQCGAPGRRVRCATRAISPRTAHHDPGGRGARDRGEPRERTTGFPGDGQIRRAVAKPAAFRRRRPAPKS
jgi:hypothetical protein